MMPTKYLLHLLMCLLVLVVPTSPTAVNQTARSINIKNHSGHKVELYWIHPQTNEAQLQSTPSIPNGADFPINSYIGHKFELRGLKKNGKCGHGMRGKGCSKAYFTVNDNSDQELIISRGMILKHDDNISKSKEAAHKIIHSCKEDTQRRLKNNEITHEHSIDILGDCVAENVSLEMKKNTEDQASQSIIRERMGELFESYTCKDYDLPITTAIDSKHWQYKHHHHEVSVFLERPASRIHFIEDFISPEQCIAMENEASNRLHSATVADGSGGSILSASRKAKQAGIKIPWHLEHEKNHLATISRKVYDYVNWALDMDIDEHGQEDLMSIQYVGRGHNETEPDRYMPHCDGDCTGSDFRPGNRMATIVMYCTVPEVGGSTNFRNSGVHVKPKPFSAVFFSYVDPDTMIMDNRFTEHSGCPVIEGEKKIVTQWVRLGVDKQSPWDSFNTNGIKFSDVNKEDNDDAPTPPLDDEEEL